ncbi:MAG: ABC transporter permease [Gemmatimonadota bacterium]
MSIGERLAGLPARMRSFWRGLRHGDTVEAEMTEEFRHHLDLRTRDLVREGLSARQAARKAKLEFGHIDGHLIDARNSRGLVHFDQLRFSALDVKLGVRMLVKYPGLSLVAVIGMAVAIAIGAGAFSLIESMMETTVPLPDGDRVVALRNAIITEPGQNRASLRDFTAWRDGLKSVEDVAAFTTTRRNLQVPGEGVELVRVVRMTASGFSLARTAPVLGRPLLEEDERDDARVLVIGYEEWQQRFAADPAIVGRRVGLGTDQYTIVGVMPEGFRFPVNDGYWIPLVFGQAERAQDDAVSLTIAARLVEGATFESAQAEFNNIGTRMAAAYPDTHQRLRPRVIHYTRAFFDLDTPGAIWTFGYLFRLFLSLLLVVVAVNVAILVYARTATRVGEIAVRTALGASRARVVTQLLAEALVLSLTAALAGLTIAGVALAKLQELAQQELHQRRFGLPFWVDLGLSPAVITYALALAIVGALIVGVLPALKATGRRVQTNLQQLSGRGGTRMQLGRAWTALIIAQVAVAVAVLPFAVHITEDAIAMAAVDPEYRFEEFLEASLAMDRADLSDTSAVGRSVMEQRFRTRAAELIRRLESDPAVAGVTMVGSYERAQVTGMASPGADQRNIALGTERIQRVDAHFFALYGMPILAGRAFTEADAHPGATAVIVNELFAEDKFGNSSVLGRQLRIPREANDAGDVEAAPWLEIVGVVDDFKADGYEPEFGGRIYLLADIAQLSAPISLAIRVRVEPAISFAPRLREIAAAVDPALQLDELMSQADMYRQGKLFPRYIAIGTTVLTVSVLLLSAAGIYAMMSFTVARRRREIGIRSALGADARQLLTSIFARASAQITAGILFGLIGTIALERLSGKGPVRDGNFPVLLLVAALMTTVGLIASLGPARRGLAVQPTEALREE